MTVDERLEKFKNYFLKNAVEGNNEYLDPLDAENFDDIYNTLTKEEQHLVDNDMTNDYDDLQKYLVCNKVLHRYWDAVSGRTSYDGVLVLSPASSALELGISLNVFLKSRSLGIYSIKQFTDVLKSGIPVYDEEELRSINLAMEWFMEDKSVRLEGLE